MKLNLPVTQIERFLEPGKPIVTKTDLQGRITYANQSFINISGFTREELQGENHHIVRHPDMPPEAFADLWRVVRAGFPWRGLVKNRTKTGNFYWVEAYVTPITEDGRTVGYMSVRSTPSRDEVRFADELYRRVRQGQAPFPQTPLNERKMRTLTALWCGTLAIVGCAWAAAAVGGPLGLALAGGTSAIAIGLALWVNSRLLDPVRRLTQAIRALDEGKLASPIPAESGPLRETGMCLEGMRIHLRAMFADVLVAARVVAEEGRHLERALTGLAGASTAQSEQLTQAAATMEEMSASISQIAENTRLGLDAVRRTEHIAHDATDKMAEHSAGSTRVVEIVRRSQSDIAEVNSAAAEIGKITQIIKGIADQTNLLALNAAIEAARAGESGRGFAIVADEVRSLAERTAASTKGISQSVEAIVKRSAIATTTMAAAATDVELGATRLDEARGRIQEIWEASREGTRISNEIREMLGQQTAATNDVAAKVEELSLAAETSNEGISTVGQAARHLSGTAEELRQLVHHLESALR
jgi:aerotaxis receptor